MELRIAIVEDQKFEAQQLKTQENFLVCNRGLLLNMDKVLRFEGDCIEMLDGARLPVRLKDKTTCLRNSHKINSATCSGSSERRKTPWIHPAGLRPCTCRPCGGDQQPVDRAAGQQGGDRPSAQASDRQGRGCQPLYGLQRVQHPPRLLQHRLHRCRSAHRHLPGSQCGDGKGQPQCLSGHLL